MEIWRKFQIAACVCAAVAVALTVATLNLHNLVYWTMWAWTITLWFLLFLWPMPVIERNKKNHQIAMALFFLLAVLAIYRYLWNVGKREKEELIVHESKPRFY